jgi:hypothetical protein
MLEREESSTAMMSDSPSKFNENCGVRHAAIRSRATHARPKTIITTRAMT